LTIDAQDHLTDEEAKEDNAVTNCQHQNEVTDAFQESACFSQSRVNAVDVGVGSEHKVAGKCCKRA
jgi:hypothetical protein